MKKPDISDAVVSARLMALGQLHRVGLALSDAGPPVSRRVFENRTLAVRVTPTSSVETSATEKKMPTLSVGKVHRIGDEFDLLCDEAGTTKLIEVRAIIVGIQELRGERCDEIKIGTQAIVTIRFLAGIPSIIAWSDSAVVRLVKAADWNLRPANV
jgi:hypothetical protein